MLKQNNGFYSHTELIISPNDNFSNNLYIIIYTHHTKIDVTFAQLSRLKEKIIVQMLINSEILFYKI